MLKANKEYLMNVLVTINPILNRVIRNTQLIFFHKILKFPTRCYQNYFKLVPVVYTKQAIWSMSYSHSGVPLYES